MRSWVRANAFDDNKTKKKSHIRWTFSSTLTHTVYGYIFFKNILVTHEAFFFHCEIMQKSHTVFPLYVPLPISLWRSRLLDLVYHHLFNMCIYIMLCNYTERAHSICAVYLDIVRFLSAIFLSALHCYRYVWIERIAIRSIEKFAFNVGERVRLFRTKVILQIYFS